MLDSDRSGAGLRAAAELTWAHAQFERTNIPAFMALPPERIPTGVIGRGDLDAGCLEALRGMSAASRRGTAEGLPSAPWIDAALGLLPARVPESNAEAFDPTPHDRFFRIARSSEAAGPAHVRGILTALQRFRDEAQLLDAAVLAGYAAIWEALMNLLRAYLRLPTARRRRARPQPEMPHDTAHPMRRWIVGHHVFAAITQGVIWALQRFEQAARQQRLEDAEAALRLTSELFTASAAAFRFAAGFDPKHYDQVIRPSMSPPVVPEGFSGGMSVDHGHLITVMRRLREPLAAARALHADAHAEMSAALAQVYDDHKFVCARFGGDELPSLRMQRQSTPPTSVDMLERFKERRTEMIQP
jgi:hypothetical protein